MKEASIFKAVAQEWGHLIGSLIKKKEKPSTTNEIISDEIK